MSDIYATRSDPSGLAEGRFTHRRVSWSALFGGVVLALALQLLLSLLGAGIGLGTINVAAGSTPDASSFGIGAAFWWVLSSCIALFAGGYASAWLAGNQIRFDAILHGLVTWGVATLMTVYLLTTAIGGIIGGGFSAMTTTASTVGSTVKDAAAPVANAVGVSPDMVKQQAAAYLQPASQDPAKMSPQEAQKEIASNLATYAQNGTDAQAAKGRIIDITAAQMKISRDDAAKKFDEAQTKVNETLAQAKQKAIATADASASAASRTSFALFVDLVLGAIAAAIGGALAVNVRRSRSTVATL